MATLKGPELPLMSFIWIVNTTEWWFKAHIILNYSNSMDEWDLLKYLSTIGWDGSNRVYFTIILESIVNSYLCIKHLILEDGYYCCI